MTASMVVLLGIPSVLSPELLYALAKMGHGDELGMTFNYRLSFLSAALAVITCWAVTVKLIQVKVNTKSDRAGRISQDH